MDIYSLNRNDLLAVLRQYTSALDKLQNAINTFTYSYNKVYHPVEKSFGSIYITILEIISILGIPTAFTLGFFIVGGIAYIITGSSAALLAGIPGALALGIIYIFFRKKVFNAINSKFQEVQNKKYGSKEDFSTLYRCEKNLRESQSLVDRMFAEFSMPEELRGIDSTKTIYRILINNNISLSKAISGYHLEKENQLLQEERERIQRQQEEQAKIMTDYMERISRDTAATRSAEEQQARYLDMMNTRDYLRGV